MRIVHAEDAHALFDPETENAFQFLPEHLPLRSLEIQGVDVLILLWRVLRILNRAVRAGSEPLPMLVHVWMIRSALESDIECNVEPVISRFGEESFEVLQGSQFGLNGFVAAFR